MKKVLVFILIFSILSFGLFAQETEVVIEKYTEEQKTAITIWTFLLGFIVALIAKEVVVDEAYGSRE